MRIGSAEPGSTFQSQALALKALLEARGVTEPVEVLTAQAASIENAQRLHAGDLDFGFMASNWIGRALRGEAPFEAPINLRMVAPANAGPLFFVVRGDSPLRFVGELRGKRVCVGPQASGMTQHAHTIFRALGMSFDDFTPVYLDFATGAKALEAGQVDAQLQCPIPNLVMSDLDARADIRVLEWEPTLLTRVLEMQPLYRRTLMHAGQLRALKSDTPQPAVVNVFVTHARVDDASVSLLAQAFLEGAHELVRTEPLYAGLPELFEPLRTQGASALEFGGVPLHPGALGAYRAAGLLP